MTYAAIYAEANVTELKDEYPYGHVMALVMGPDFPLSEAFDVYDWNATSTDTPDDYEVIKPKYGAFATVGRWLRVDLDEKPQVNADFNATVGPGLILNKPSFSAVATSGSYSDLSGSPSLATVATSGDYNHLINKPILSPVASTGSYNDLTSKPTIPASQVQSDWNASTGLGAVLNKPTVQSIQRMRVQTSTLGAYTYTFPIAYGSGVIPVIGITVEDNSSAQWSYQITSISNTSVTIQLTKTTAVTLLGISVLGIAATPQAYVHITAVAP